jgi:hypothetical protein
LKKEAKKQELAEKINEKTDGKKRGRPKKNKTEEDDFKEEMIEFNVKRTLEDYDQLVQ